MNINIQCNIVYYSRVSLTCDFQVIGLLRDELNPRSPPERISMLTCAGCVELVEPRVANETRTVDVSGAANRCSGNVGDVTLPFTTSCRRQRLLLDPRLPRQTRREGDGHAAVSNPKAPHWLWPHEPPCDERSVARCPGGGGVRRQPPGSPRPMNARLLYL